MILSMHIENFKCFKDFDIELGPFNVLIGPNDSGKTAFLEALRIMTVMPGQGSKTAADLERSLGISLGAVAVWQGRRDPIVIDAGLGDRERKTVQRYRVRSADGMVFEGDVTAEPSRPDALRAGWKDEVCRQYIGTGAYYQFDPSALRMPSRVDASLDSRGSGFPSLLARIKLADHRAFEAIESELIRRFPSYSTIPLEPTKLSVVEPTQVGARLFHKVEREAYRIKFKTRFGADLPAQVVSDGVLLSLAYLTVCHHPGVLGILMVEEPENGVHHASLREIVSTLRTLAGDKGVQVVLTTHSPYLLDLVEPEEVRVFVKDDKEGAVHASKMSDAPDVQDLKKHFMTGEIWTTEGEEKLALRARGRE